MNRKLSEEQTDALIDSYCGVARRRQAGCCGWSDSTAGARRLLLQMVRGGAGV